MRAIGFDLDGTLLEYACPSDELLRDAVEAVAAPADSDGFEADYDAFGERFDACDPSQSAAPSRRSVSWRPPIDSPTTPRARERRVAAARARPPRPRVARRRGGHV